MVLVPIHRVTRKLLGIFGIVLVLVAVFILLEQMRNIYHQHLKFRRLQSYSQYVDDVSKDLDRLENLANKSSLTVDQFFIMLGQLSPKQNSFNFTHNVNSVNDNQTTR